MGRYGSEAREFLRMAGIAKGERSVFELTRAIQGFLRFPFENATKILSRSKNDKGGWLRRPDTVLDENISLGTGGTCFSLTFFMKCILEEMGFDAYPVLCDRSYGPATHSALIVLLDGKRYLVDPGYILGRPLALPAIGSNDGKMVSIARLSDTSQYILSTRSKNGKKLRYRFKDIETPDEQFEKAWTDSFDWPMMRHLSIGLATPGGFMFSRDKKMRGDVSSHGATTTEHLSRTFGIDESILEEALRCIRTNRK